VPDQNAVLVFSYVGFGTQEVTVGSRTNIAINMSNSASTNLNEVVVVGYGTQRRRDLTGSVASVKGTELAKQPVLTATQALQGKVAGVQITTSGAPNAAPVVRVRGTGTILGGANPLYVVDGVITEDIRNINTADITSMDILKDASSTAIYGMRAANGVLLITTKKGRTGKPVFSYDGTVGIREATNLVDMAGPAQYIGYFNEATKYYGNPDDTLSAALLNGTHTDWFDEVLRRAFQQNHNVSVSGGGKLINYFVSAGYITEQGILLKNDFNRFTIRNNNEYRVTDKLRLGTQLSYSHADLDNVNEGNALNSAYRASPYVPALLNGKYGNTSATGNVGNPLVGLDYSTDKGINNRFQGTFTGDYKLLSWLHLRTSFGLDNVRYENTLMGLPFANTGANNIFIEAGGNQQRLNTSFEENVIKSTKWVWDNTATFTKIINRHNFNFLLGATAEKYHQRNTRAKSLDYREGNASFQEFKGDEISFNINNPIPNDKWSRNSYLSRLNYNFDDRYLITATFRADGTSRFPERNRWGYFPSIGLGWNVAKEAFMEGQSFFDDLKFRGSWGKVGNDQIAQGLYTTFANTGLPYFFDGQQVYGISLDDVVDEDLQWEITDEFDAGVDIGLMNNRLNLVFDYYKKTTEDVLLRVPLPAFTGDADYITNLGSIENKGIELTLGWNDRIGNVNYNLSANMARNKNKVLELNAGQAVFGGGVGQSGTTTKTDVGQPIGSFFVFQTSGIFQTDADAAASAQGAAGAKAGDLMYVDQNKDGAINAADRVYVGSYQPKMIYGFNGGINVKSFDFSFTTYGTQGSKIYNGKKAARGDVRDNIEADVARNRWTPDRQNTNVPRANLGILPHSTYFIESGDFFRINNLTFGYTLPKSIFGSLGLNRTRVYLTAQNPVTWTKYSGFTPELSSNNTIDAGIEQGAYPSVRTFAFGLNINF
jgi:TonB-linked SusC/RagA family outer membrane protein